MHQSLSQNNTDLRPQIFVYQWSDLSLQIQKLLPIWVRNQTRPRSAHTSPHCPPRRPRHHGRTGAHICVTPPRAETACVEMRPPISQCYHTLQKKIRKTEMSVLLLKNVKPNRLFLNRNCHTTNTFAVDINRHKFRVMGASLTGLCHSFAVRTVSEWNQLPAVVVEWDTILQSCL